MNRELRCKVCPDCGETMIQSMCVRGCEYVCILCGKALPFFCEAEDIMILGSEHDKLYEKYSKDIHKLAFEKGGAGCNSCGELGGNNCETCNIEYDYKYYRKNEK